MGIKYGVRQYGRLS